MSDSLRAFKAELFQALAHPTRVAVVETLRDGELSAGELMERLKVEQANLSQHLAVLRAKHVVVTRKSGNQVYYSIRYPVLVKVLDVLKQYFYAHLDEMQQTLDEIEDRPRASRPRVRRSA